MTDLSAEATRINRDLGRILRQDTPTTETPMRLHSREIDAGGAPEFHPAFLRYLGNTTVCSCGRPAQCAAGCRATRWDEHLPACEPACRKDDQRFHVSQHRNNPNRLKRALRQVRKLNPKAYDLLYLILALHYSWSAACAKLRNDDLVRGHEPRTEATFAVLWISGASMLTAAF